MKTTMKKSIARVLTMVLALTMLMSLAVPALAAEIEAAEGFDEVPYGVFKFYQTWNTDKEAMGTAFLINEDHIITAGHCVRESEEWAKRYGVKGKLKEEFYENYVFEVAIRRDVTIEAELVIHSEEMDFAILKLAQPVATRKYLTLRDCGELKAGDLVWSVGFPAFHEGQTYDNDYTPAGVTTKPGSVTKAEALTEYYTTSGYHFKGMALSTNVALSGGDSGGPMVDQNGYVVGVSVVSASGQEQSEVYYQATSINQVMALCDDLGIEYHTNEEAPAPTEAPVATEAPTQATEVPTQATEAPTQATEAPTQATEETKPVIIDDPDPFNPTILIVAAVAVLAVIIIIVVVMSKGKKKAPAAPTGYTAPTAPSGGFTAPTYTAPMGAGETTVLASDAGETTILNHAANGGTLIRKRTNETITINAERFIIGRERKTANYCISDNSSISRSHVTLTVKNGTTYLTDMNAANGTFLNGVKVLPNQETALKSGDKIKLADEEFEFRV